MDGGADANIDGGADACPAGIVVDFPCFLPFDCLNDHQYQRRRTIPCQELFPDCPCSGAQCERSPEIETCPADQICNPIQASDDPDEPACISPDAGMPDA